MKRLRIGVVYGGPSTEHEISLASAAAVFANLDPKLYETFPIYVRRNGHWSLPSQPPNIDSAIDVIKASRLRDETFEDEDVDHPGQTIHFVPDPDTKNPAHFSFEYGVRN